MSSSKVVNVKVANIRPKYKNLEEWMSDSNNCYIGRGGIVFIDGCRFPKSGSIWANPFKISKTQTRDDVLKLYEEYIKKKIIDEDLHEELEKLRGKNLGCWCAPDKCHGDILLKILESL